MSIEKRSLPLLERFLVTPPDATCGNLSGKNSRYVIDYLRGRLEILFQASGMDILEHLKKYPYASCSVLNYGVGNLAGKEISGINTLRLAGRIRQAIIRFEPRINATRLRVYFVNVKGGDGTTLHFIIESEVHYQQETFAFSLDSYWNTDSGEVQIIPFYSGIAYG